jgi:uncharacterized coiled-coil protein SlyX
MKNNKTKTIEEYVAHLQLMVDDLNAVVTEQNKEISNLKQKVEFLLSRETEREYTDQNSLIMSDSKPPHW